MIRCLTIGLAIALLLAPSLAAADDETRPGGAATSKGPRNRSAFSNPSGNMSFERQLDFKVGDGVFRKLWVAAPASTRSSDGLGPLFNARACQACHLKDGRGRPPAAGETPASLLFALGSADGKPDPVYGGQLQTFGIQGHAAEASLRIEYQTLPVTLADGETITLRRPVYHFSDFAYGAIDTATRFSPRIAPPMIGVGLLELIPEADILARADPDDRNNDGIRGITRKVWSAAEQREMLGRFGWKNGAATIADQTANAFFNDMGLSTDLHRDGFGDCSPAQAACRSAPHGVEAADDVEVPRKLFDLTVFYARNLAVPTRENSRAADVQRGQNLFGEIGCTACHMPRQVTGSHPDRPELSNQVIWPYTDLLLHDMGDDLADGGKDGRLWRTPPLWGLGLTKRVNDHEFMLHDGRADGILEAILWHGGEAAAARQRVIGLSKPDRAALLSFLNSL